MINDQLLNYVRQQQSQNVSRELIIHNLKTTGWSESDISEAFAALASTMSSPQAVPAQIVPTMMGSAAVSQPQMQPQPQMQYQQPRMAQPQFSNMPQSMMQQKAQAAKPKSGVGKKIFFTILILILLAAAEGGAYAYYTGVFVSLPTLTSQALDAARTMKSGTFDTTMNIDFSGMQSAAASVNQLIPGGLGSQ